MFRERLQELDRLLQSEVVVLNPGDDPSKIEDWTCFVDCTELTCVKYCDPEFGDRVVAHDLKIMEATMIAKALNLQSHFARNNARLLIDEGLKLVEENERLQEALSRMCNAYLPLTRVIFNLPKPQFERFRGVWNVMENAHEKAEKALSQGGQS